MTRIFGGISHHLVFSDRLTSSWQKLSPLRLSRLIAAKAMPYSGTVKAKEESD